MKAYFVRHGETDWNALKKIQGSTDIPLNNTGIAQAKELGKHLLEQGVTVSKIYSSRLDRAYETAKIVANVVHQPVILLNDLEEICFGKWEGMTWKEVREQFPEQYNEWYDHRRYTVPPEGESYQMLLERMLRVVKRILKENEENVLVVTHSANIVVLLAMLHHTPFAKMFKVHPVGNTDYVELDQEELEKIGIDPWE